jgi:hypothetical protein
MKIDLQSFNSLNPPILNARLTTSPDGDASAVIAERSRPGHRTSARARTSMRSRWPATYCAGSIRVAVIETARRRSPSAERRGRVLHGNLRDPRRRGLRPSIAGTPRKRGTSAWPSGTRPGKRLELQTAPRTRRPSCGTTRCPNPRNGRGSKPARCRRGPPRERMRDALERVRGLGREGTDEARGLPG